MGTIRNGGNGAFSGKAGSFIGSSWNKIDYIKGIPKLSKKPASLKQLDQRARFAAVLAYLGPIKDLLTLGYKGQTGGRATGFNMGIQHALNHAVIGTYPSYEVDKSLIQISKGTLQKPSGVVLSSPADGNLKVKWSTLSNDLTAFADDKMLILLYNPVQHFFLVFTDASTRGEGETLLQIPNDFAGQTVHTYLFYVHRDGDRQSNSIYVAEFTIPELEAI